MPEPTNKGLAPNQPPVRKRELKSHRFRRLREDDWKALETLVAKIERGHIKRLSPDEIVALPALYRSTLSSLSVARATSLDQNLIGYLEGLCARAYYVIYGTHVSLWERLLRFFARDWPQAARALLPETFISTVILILGAVIAYVLVSHNPDWYANFIPDSLAGNRNMSSSTESLRDTLYDGNWSDSLATFATFLFSHNSRVAIFAFALGFAFCIPTAFLTLYNGCILGAFVALFASRGLGFEVGGWLIIHGATEIFALILAGACGFHIGKAMAFPGRVSRREALTQAGLRAGILMAGVIIMLFIAGILEGFARQLVTDDITRYSVGVSSFIMWCYYFYAPRRQTDGENHRG